MTAPIPLRKRTFVDGVTEREDADVLAFRMAAVLTRAGLVERYGVSVRRIPVSRGEEGWGVYLTDRMPSEDPPAGLRFTAPVHRTPHLRAA
ncbi:hypothetical protein ACFQ67_27335 [Streptomyces sp. NPDC056488]|uniref:hypothetical protein n=1 Tax=Streptomyces sp. NPDC056488 TaxID=3345836 RepID=UPI0036BBDA10